MNDIDDDHSTIDEKCCVDLDTVHYNMNSSYSIE